MQNREQALGYCLDTLFHHNLGIKRFFEVFRNLSKAFDEEREYSNSENLNIFGNVLEYMDFEEDEINEMSSTMYWIFDSNTEEEAGLVYAFFTRGRPMLARNLQWDEHRPRTPLKNLRERRK
jgi:hypothetical protein